MSLPPCCSTCRYAGPTNFPDRFLCQRYPPTVMLTDNPDSPYEVCSARPTVAATDWCGDFVEKQ